ncbi:uncharacterized protein MONBRDRAFT_29920 [Monosiga brevicollis MX1]|uniref:SH3 domain-containing protein n=1 Tax=Monosiga brevicollis TaxID=81824 RepID=A9VCI1_MONBE|nr:uncharacterized protein MONBRDRAFT_29920 [Monosiga brevicollis MX1]EDQ84788.1 predicted protein [Monosiga brevicollis MX1]|eukprot:XP_001750438.1 hypothetical protein [Monosiga brevicollis MX1]
MLKKDKVHAERLAKLAASANARGAAPLPPGMGGAAAAPAPSAAPAEVVKFRAIEGFKSDEVDFEKGATVFVVGEPDASGMVQAVAGGKAGKIPMDKLRKITHELLEEERKQREKEIAEARQAEEDSLREEMEKMKLEGPSKGSGAAASAAAEKTPEQLAYEAELEKKFEEEASRSALLEEEEKLKAEAARIEAMLAALDEED